MRSLRARLIAVLLALAGAGLVVLAAVTYTEQRSFLEGRLDQEVQAAAPVLDNILDEETDAQEGERAAQGAAGGAPQDSPSDQGPLGAPGAGAAGEAHRQLPNLPPGTFGELREPSGKVVHEKFLTFGQAKPAKPEIPAHVTPGRLFTVRSEGSSGLEYRVFATPARDGDFTIAAVPTSEVRQTLDHLLLVEGLVIGGVLLLLAFGASWAVRLGLRPLDRIGRTASEIAAGELSRRVSPAEERTEVGRLGLALNAMLERLEQAFAERTSSEERLRRFLADASHELRTPLASIRGYAELFRMGAAREEQEVELAMRRIEEESSRMGTLVEDLLTLARLDRERAPLRLEVDLGVLAADAVADARAVAPEREISLSAQDGLVVCGEADQLRQVLANLLRNALVHTPAGTPVEVSLAREGELARLSIRDHGPGLPGAGDELFERFWRAERGRERGRAGAGLGLAITRAIVLAHGGSVEARNAPGGGAIFTLRLPPLRAGTEGALPPPGGVARAPGEPRGGEPGSPQEPAASQPAGGS
jgi:two-component system OmpR family sensor kinase